MGVIRHFRAKRQVREQVGGLGALGLSEMQV